MSVSARVCESSFIFYLFALILVLGGCGPETINIPSPSPPPKLADLLRTRLAETPPGTPTLVVLPSPSQTLYAADPTTSTITATLTSIPVPTDTSQPTVSPTVSADSPPISNVVQARIMLRSIYVRSGPGTTYDILGLLNRGDEVPVLARDRTSSWYNILTTDGKAGWIAASVSELIGTDADLSRIEIALTIPRPPTPTPSRTPLPTATQTPPPPPSNPQPTATPRPPTPLPTAAPTQAPSPTANPYP